jgi:hypothetical protein
MSALLARIAGRVVVDAVDGGEWTNEGSASSIGPCCAEDELDAEA